MFALSGIASQNATQIDPLATQNAMCVAPMCDTKESIGCLIKTLNVRADDNGLKMQSSVRHSGSYGDAIEYINPYFQFLTRLILNTLITLFCFLSYVSNATVNMTTC